MLFKMFVQLSDKVQVFVYLFDFFDFYSIQR